MYTDPKKLGQRMQAIVNAAVEVERFEWMR
jgi:hypothetical protein